MPQGEESKVKNKNQVNFVDTASGPAQKAFVVHDRGEKQPGMKVHEVDFTFIAARMSSPKEPPKKGGRKDDDRFCSSRGTSTAAQKMTDKPKRKPSPSVCLWLQL